MGIDDLKQYFETYVKGFQPYKDSTLYKGIVNFLINYYFKHSYDEIPALFKTAYETQQTPSELYVPILRSNGFPLDVIDKLSFRHQRILLNSLIDYNRYKGSINIIKETADIFNDDINIYELFIDYIDSDWYFRPYSIYLDDSIKEYEILDKITYQPIYNGTEHFFISKNQLNELYFSGKITLPIKTNLLLLDRRKLLDYSALTSLFASITLKELQDEKIVVFFENFTTELSILNIWKLWFYIIHKFYQNTLIGYGGSHVDGILLEDPKTVNLECNSIYNPYLFIENPSNNVFNFLINGVSDCAVLIGYDESLLIYPDTCDTPPVIPFQIITEDEQSIVTETGDCVVDESYNNLGFELSPTKMLLYDIDYPGFDFTFDDLDDFNTRYNGIDCLDPTKVLQFYDSIVKKLIQIPSFPIARTVTEMEASLIISMGLDVIVYTNERIEKNQQFRRFNSFFLLEELYNSLITAQFTSSNLNIRNYIHYILDILPFIFIPIKDTPTYLLIDFLKPFHVELVSQSTEILRVKDCFNSGTTNSRLANFIFDFESASVASVSHFIGKMDIEYASALPINIIDSPTFDTIYQTGTLLNISNYYVINEDVVMPSLPPKIVYTDQGGTLSSLLSAVTIPLTPNSNLANGYQFPDNTGITVTTMGRIDAPENVIWHWQLGAETPDVHYFGRFLFIPAGSALSIMVDNTPTFVHNFVTVPDPISVWYEYGVYTSPPVVISFNATGIPLCTTSAVGAVNELLNPTDLGFTTRTFQYRQYTSGDNLWYPFDFKQLLFSSDHSSCGTVGRTVTWKYEYTGYPVNTLPPGLTVMYLQKTKVMGSPSLSIAPEVNLNSVVGLPTLGTLTVWLELDGAPSASTDVILINAGTF